ncbi:MAG TPA: nucleotidyltransferase [Gallicola sp.]|nr:nucleotidyltransferase [Gallicola sp.]
MRLQQIKQKLMNEEYNFLKDQKSLGDNIILLTIGGSHAYGTDVETSDLDIRGIALNSKKEILTMNCDNTPIVEKQTDTTIYFLKQIIRLLINANPNCIEILGTKPEHLFICTEEGKLLRDNAKIFLSKKAKHSFGGYATSQLRRLQNALARDSYSQKEKEQHILGSIQNQIEHFKMKYHQITSKNINLYIDKSCKKDFDEEIYIDMNLEHYPLRDLRSMYSDMLNVVKNYENLNHRNNKKDELHLNKHAMHLIRLLIVGTEILEGKGINTYREKDRDLLLKIRNGEFVKQKDGKNDYSLIFEMVNEYDKKFKYAAENTDLPDNPNYEAINDLVSDINRRVLSR